MSAAIVKAAALAALCQVALCLVPSAVAAQTGGDAKSERGMPPEKAGKAEARSERDLPKQPTPAGTPPAAAERAMPSDRK